MIVRGPRKDSSFTVLHNDILRDKRLSYRARGLLGFVLSQPEGYGAQSDRLAAESGDHEGRDAIRTALKELAAAGYLRRDRKQQPDGRWTTTSVVYEDPEPTTGNPSSVRPAEMHESAGGAEDGSADVGFSGANSRRTTSEELEELPLGDLAIAGQRGRCFEAGSDQDPLFAEFWASYPSKKDKGGSRKAWRAAIKKTAAQDIIGAAKRFAADPNLPEPSYIPHPKTWLNGERWNDGPLPRRVQRGPGRGDDVGVISIANRLQRARS